MASCSRARIAAFSLALVVGISSSAMAGNGQVSLNEDVLHATSVEVMKQALEHEEQWPKVHAAEGLVRNNYGEGVRDAFVEELNKQPSATYRVGIWRVLVQSAGNDEAFKQDYLSRIIEAAKTPDAPNRNHAMESLGKLGWLEDTPEIAEVAQNGSGAIQANARWVMANSGSPESQTSLAELLDSPDTAVRGSVAYALRHLDSLTPDTVSRLIKTCWAEPSESAARIYLLSAVYVHTDTEDHNDDRKRAQSELLRYLESGDRGQKSEVCCAFAQAGKMSDMRALEALLQDADADVRICASNAVLRIIRRQFRGLQWLDWTVISLYGLFMVSVGLWCSRRQNTTEEYFLASRNMNPIIIGISMFATLLSTITYLGTPGEVIKHGPTMMLAYLAVPFTYVVAGYLLIPRIMKFRITSAYELLETKLGLKTRLLGSIIFIMTRLVWMAMLVYIAAKLLCEMLNWGDEMIPVVVAATGFLAVIYTAMGGLRAVVITDCFQFILLIGGAVLTLVLITVQMGGLGWFPTEWAPHWDSQPLFSWNISTRVTIVGAVISGFLWWVCTAGSDQVAIQRYLATPNAKTARRAFLVNAVSDVSVAVILYTVGFALLGFYSANRHMIPDGKSLIADADYLFPRYIANVLPMGCAGLVVAGMFAAAMSSLDSGINSIVTVSFKDFIERLRKRPDTQLKDEGSNVKGAKYLVLAIGLIVVLLSSQISRVPGNIFEVTSKTNGLFVGPLFGLFFMAIFVPWAKAFGAIIGAVYGFTTAVIFAYWDKITGAPTSLSFQLIIFSALSVQIPVSMLVSRISAHKKSFLHNTAISILLLLPLAALLFVLSRWGLIIAQAFNLGFAQN